jgi:hypothetical protein
MLKNLKIVQQSLKFQTNIKKLFVCAPVAQW